MLDKMRNLNGQLVEYGYKVKAVEVDRKLAMDPESYPVTVVTERAGKEEVFQAKYVLVSQLFLPPQFCLFLNFAQGCDGAHSAVRKSLGFKMVGDSSDAVWGVMDVYPQTNFPDIRKKAILQSQYGTLMIIPREGGSLARFYIELPAGTKAKDVTLEDLCSVSRKIFHPYRMDFGGFFWWSAYSIGQRLADHFSKDNRVFLTGDACHTHSPKGGQGMNTSLQDGYNIGWKLAAVIKGQATPDLLQTYIIERQKVAADLIAFDRELTGILHSKTADGNLQQDFSEHFIKSGRYMAGLTATYEDSSITRAEWSIQSLAPNLKVGMRFPSTQVVRFCDAKAMQLVKALPADGSWRIVIFAGDIRCEDSAQKLRNVCASSQRKPRKG
jgi:phenol 2-monooxygenase